MNEINSKRILVIGGSGFMGSHTADELSARGHKVTVFDWIESPFLRNDQHMIVGDMMERAVLSRAFENIDYVYYFAGVADIGEAKSNPYETINTNVMGVTLALDVAISAGIQRFVYASTMYVYSSHGSFYRASKQAAESIVKAYNEAYGMDYTFLRYGSLYGPRSQPWNGLYKYVEQVIREGRLNYGGTGEERREYIHVKDAARLSVDILDDRHKNKAVTVTGLQVLDSKTLINMIFEITGVEYNVSFSGKNVSGDHYKITPYRYQPEQAMKIVPDEFVDIGQGIMDLIVEIHTKLGD